eukprot:Phypoly_transcript_26351.p1 GENE.Phypoly_transcript_26351~~Phypoly_transcript_26351.p1  ORF type:complete len:118 (+),score=17.94 Phypoly_transcript_26351:116-469(+)
MGEFKTSVYFCLSQKFTGSAFGITAKIPKNSITIEKGQTKKHEGDNGSGKKVTREFCGTCGSGITEYGENAGENTYVFYGSLDDPDTLPPKGEFFCKYRAKWMPEIPGIFHKQEIKE